MSYKATFREISKLKLLERHYDNGISGIVVFVMSSYLTTPS